MTARDSVHAFSPGSAEPGHRNRVIEANVLIDYWPRLADAVDLLVDDPSPRPDPANFAPGFALPNLDEPMQDFLAPAVASWVPLDTYAGHALTLLDLTGNPGTRTTKTFASLVIVARAIEFLRRTGQGVFIVSPTSANKGTALRDAVLRAYTSGLATPDELRVAIVAPSSCAGKLRGGQLCEDTELRQRNPLMVYDGSDGEAVKPLARTFVTECALDILRETGLFPWFTLDLANYVVADTARAFFEDTVSPPTSRRTHVHAVSSAFGLLGYHEGRRWLEHAGHVRRADRPASLLVQHLATPDMVLHLLTGSHDRTGLPFYQIGSDGLHHQELSPHFPAIAADPDESIDPTFYSHRPITSPRMDALIAEHGGSGIVVSRHECLARYQQIRERIAAVGRELPGDPADLREWSVVMALTGALNAVDRGLLPDTDDIVVHGTGWYSVGEFVPPPPGGIIKVRTVSDIRQAVLR